jgi:predicted RNA-binding Zn-ribbon protein involved in translation (DUF1610 family)
MTEARTITLTLTRGQFDDLALAAMEGADSPDLAAARDALEQAWVNAEPGRGAEWQCPRCGRRMLAPPWLDRPVCVGVIVDLATFDQHELTPMEPVDADTRTTVTVACPVCGAAATRMMPSWPHPPLLAWP